MDKQAANEAAAAEPGAVNLPRMSSSEEDWGEGRGLLQTDDERQGAVDAEDGSGRASLSLDALLDEIGLGRWNVGIVLICGLGNAADAVEAMCMGYILPELPDVGAAQRGVLTSAIFVGMLFGGLVCGSICDQYGRRPCLLFSLGITFAFGLMSSAMPTWDGVAFCRVAAGFGVGGAVPATFTLGIEVVPRARRGLMQNVIAAHWMVGTLFTAGLAWYILGNNRASAVPGEVEIAVSTVGGAVPPWRIFAALCALPSGLTFMLVWTMVPESPRFLMVQGKHAQALRVLNIGAAKHGHRPLDVTASDLSPASGQRRPQNTFRQNVQTLFAHPLRQTTLLLCGIWAALNFGWYGLLNWLPTVFDKLHLEMDAYESAFLTVAANAPGNLFAMALADRVGRKTQLAGSTGVSAVVGVCFAFATTPTGALTAACFFNAISVGAWNSLDCLSAESFPTSLRGTALAVLAAVGRLGSTAAQFYNSELVERDAVAVLLLTSAGTMLCASAMTMALPKETAGVALQDTVTIKADKLRDRDSAGGDEGIPLKLRP